MNEHIVILDGAQGTLLWQKAAEWGIPKASVWTYNMTHPEIVAEVCREYAEAGSEIICSNTFSVNRLTVEQESDYSVQEVVFAAVKIAKEVLAGTGVRVALDIGPLPVLTEPYGDLKDDEAEAIFDEVVRAGTEAGADCIFLETFMQLGMLLAAFRAAKRSNLPVFCSMSFEANGRTIFGASVEEMLSEIKPEDVCAVGMNCSLGPDLALPVIREFAEKTDLPLFFKPNAGIPVTGPDGSLIYSFTAEEYTRHVAAALATGRIRYLGGCCGTNPEFIRQLKALTDSAG